MYKKTAVLLMAHGAPESLDDIPAYIQHIMKGREASDAVIDQVRERYRLVGGKSPLLEMTRRQAASLEKRLNQSGDDFKVYIGMRHWHPFIAETVREIVEDPPDRLLALSLAPQYSTLSVEAYFQTLQSALTSAGLDIPVRRVKSWYNQAELIEAFSEKIQEALGQYDASARVAVQLLFTAHSLPESVVERGDPYPREVDSTVSAILQKLDIDPASKNWSFAYQSQGFRGGKWLGPEVEKVLGILGEAGKSEVLVVPIGFVCDHVEILYDIDILYKGLAASHGITLRRTDSLNASPRFIEALAQVVRNNLLQA
ncbi:MAG: ferrochelatase [Nitrospiria bacterium]